MYSGRQDEHHSSGVTIIMTKEAAKTLEEWTPISERIIKARFWSRHIKTTLIQVYAPTNDADEETKDSFYEQLQSVIHLTPHHDIAMRAILMQRLELSSMEKTGLSENMDSRVREMTMMNIFPLYVLTTT